MRFKNMFTGQETHAAFYDGENHEEICEKLGVILVKRDEHIDQSAIFASRHGELTTRAERWLYFDPNDNGVWTMKDENFRKIWIPEDEDPRDHLDLYVNKTTGVLRSGVRFDGTNTLVVVHMFPHVLSFNYDVDKSELIIVEEKNGHEIQHNISHGSWIVSTMYGDSYYPVRGRDTYFDARFIKLNDQFGKKD